MQTLNNRLHAMQGVYICDKARRWAVKMPLEVDEIEFKVVKHGKPRHSAWNGNCLHVHTRVQVGLTLPSLFYLLYVFKGSVTHTSDVIQAG